MSVVYAHIYAAFNPLSLHHNRQGKIWWGGLPRSVGTAPPPRHGPHGKRARSEARPGPPRFEFTPPFGRYNVNHARPVASIKVELLSKVHLSRLGSVPTYKASSPSRTAAKAGSAITTSTARARRMAGPRRRGRAASAMLYLIIRELAQAGPTRPRPDRQTVSSLTAKKISGEP